MIIGLAPLLKMRRTGHKPSGLVFLNVFDTEPFGCRDWDRYSNTIANPQLWIKPGTHPALLDLGALIGLPVLVHADRWSAWLGQLWDAVLAVPPTSATLAVTEFGEDIGLFWTVEYGQRAFGDPAPDRDAPLLVLAGDRREAETFAARQGTDYRAVVHIESVSGIRELASGWVMHVLPGATKRPNYRELIDRAQRKFTAIRYEEAA